MNIIRNDSKEFRVNGRKEKEKKDTGTEVACNSDGVSQRKGTQDGRSLGRRVNRRREQKKDIII